MKNSIIVVMVLLITNKNFCSAPPPGYDDYGNDTDSYYMHNGKPIDDPENQKIFWNQYMASQSANNNEEYSTSHGYNYPGAVIDPAHPTSFMDNYGNYYNTGVPNMYGFDASQGTYPNNPNPPKIAAAAGPPKIAAAAGPPKIAAAAGPSRVDDDEDEDSDDSSGESSSKKAQKKQPQTKPPQFKPPQINPPQKIQPQTKPPQFKPPQINPPKNKLPPKKPSPPKVDDDEDEDDEDSDASSEGSSSNKAPVKTPPNKQPQKNPNLPKVNVDEIKVGDASSSKKKEKKEGLAKSFLKKISIGSKKKGQSPS